MICILPFTSGSLWPVGHCTCSVPMFGLVVVILGFLHYRLVCSTISIAKYQASNFRVTHKYLVGIGNRCVDSCVFSHLSCTECSVAGKWEDTLEFTTVTGSLRLIFDQICMRQY